MISVSTSTWFSVESASNCNEILEVTYWGSGLPTSKVKLYSYYKKLNFAYLFKTQTTVMSFYKNSIFGINRDPCHGQAGSTLKMQKMVTTIGITQYLSFSEEGSLSNFSQKFYF